MSSTTSRRVYEVPAVVTPPVPCTYRQRFIILTCFMARDWSVEVVAVLGAL